MSGLQQPEQQAHYIYKICARQDWAQACARDGFSGAGVDVDDGFIHFSSAHQIEGTAKKYFSRARWFDIASGASGRIIKCCAFMGSVAGWGEVSASLWRAFAPTGQSSLGFSLGL